MNFAYLALSILADAEVVPSPQNVEFELAIWKWVVIISVGVFIVLFAVKRLADVAAKKKTASIIETVVGPGGAKGAENWQETDDIED